MVSALYPRRDLALFVADYARYVENVDTSRVFERHRGECEAQHCPFIAREYRERERADFDAKARAKIYPNCADAKGVTIAFRIAARRDGRSCGRWCLDDAL